MATSSGRLEKATNIAIIVVCVMVSVHLAVGLYRSNSPRQNPSTYKAGDQVHDTAGLGLKNSSMTVLLVISSRCQYCELSMPFYKRLVEKSHRAGARVVGVTDEDIAVNQAYLNSKDVRVEAVVSRSSNDIQAHSTPTLILVRRDGRVVGSWVGRLTGDREKEVLTAIAGAS